MDSLSKTVVEGGYCIGCGACASLPGSPFRMQLNAFGMMQATLGEESAGTSKIPPVEEVCPFSGKSVNEDAIAQDLYSTTCSYDERLGFFSSIYSGHVLEKDYRDRGSSGGMASWIQCELLRAGLVDGVVNVQQRIPTESDKRLFAFAIARTEDEIRLGAKSRYYPVELSEVLQTVRECPGRYAIVGIPCFIKAVRLLCRKDPILASRVAFCIGLLCGHLKSAAFAESLAWQLGIAPADLLNFDFRKKLPDRAANQYGVEANGVVQGGPVCRSSPVSSLLGSDWGGCFFMYKACDFCDDIFAETADIVVGDAWLPQFVSDSQGTNVLVLRNPQIRSLLEKAAQDERVRLESLSIEDLARSQAGVLRHRRDGLKYRLHLADKRGEWRPAKRIESSVNHLTKWERKRYEYRQMIRDESHRSFALARSAGDLSLFTRRIKKLTNAYYSIGTPRWKWYARRVKSLILWTLRCFR